MKRAGLATPDGVLGVIETGSFDSSLLRHALTNLPGGTWELVCHPGYDDADLRASLYAVAPRFATAAQVHGTRVVEHDGAWLPAPAIARLAQAFGRRPFVKPDQVGATAI